MNRLALVACALALVLLGCKPARTPPKGPPPTPALPKPRLVVGRDDFPAGHATPEGAACDLARAFIGDDAALFTITCLPAYGDLEVRDRYKEFLHGVVQGLLERRALNLDPASDNPKAIAQVFVARPLGHSGPASYGHVAFGFRVVMFVDVDALLNDGSHAINRTLVVQVNDGQWYVHPAPDITPLLADGLDDETPSTQTLADVYDLVR